MNGWSRFTEKSVRVPLPQTKEYLRVCAYKDGTYSPKSSWVSVKAGASNATKVTFTRTIGQMTVGGNSQFSAYSNGSVSKSVRWSTSDADHATVNSSGVVTAKKAGTVYIIATAHDGITGKVKVTLIDKYPARVTISGATTFSLGVRLSKQLSATTSAAVFNGVTWSSSNPLVATVDSTGKVTAKATGTAVIKCTAIGGAYDTVNVTVITRVEAMVRWAEKIAADDDYGYSMSTTITSNNTIADRRCHICNSKASKDYDCASFVTAAIAHGYRHTAFIPVCRNYAPDCGGLKTLLLKNGWKDMGKLDVSKLKRGDILMNPHSHVEIYDGKGYDVAAHSDKDGKPGGNTTLGKYEISISKTYSFYTTVLRK
jgi:hypothetical protein